MAAERGIVGRSWSTDKADFARHGDRVSKRYLRRGVATRDAALLRLIAERYPPLRYEGWTYRALRVHGADESRNTLTMEYVAGHDVRSLFEATRDPSVFRHAGRWLGRLHAGDSPDDPRQVITFNDFNCSNVIVDAVDRQVVAVDPGSFRRQFTSPGISLAIGALSAGRTSMRLDPRSMPGCLGSYLRGYLEVGTRGRLPHLRAGWFYVVQRIYEGRSQSLFRRAPLVLKVAAGVAESSLWAVVTSVIGLGIRRDIRHARSKDSIEQRG